MGKSTLIRALFPKALHIDLLLPEVEEKLIEEKHFKFALSGSNCRKLKRGRANLLAGRAFVYELFPYTFVEMKLFFDLEFILRWGSLPKVFEFHEEYRILFLRSYVQTYLKDEIVAEQLDTTFNLLEIFWKLPLS